MFAIKDTLAYLRESLREALREDVAHLRANHAFILGYLIGVISCCVVLLSAIAVSVWLG